ncbi:hypothetical protein Tco_0630880 [Tanacetum coccineum]
MSEVTGSQSSDAAVTYNTSCSTFEARILEYFHLRGALRAGPNSCLSSTTFSIVMYRKENQRPVYIPEPEHPGDLPTHRLGRDYTYTTPRPGGEVENSAAAARQKLRIEERGLFLPSKKVYQTRQDLARSEAHCKALEARVIVLETEARRHEWQRQAADDLAVSSAALAQLTQLGIGTDKPSSGTGVRGSERAPREVHYQQVLLTRWNPCKTVTHDVAYSMTFVDQRKKLRTNMSTKRMKKLEQNCGTEK